MLFTKRSVVRFGGSKAVILPSDWVNTYSIKEKQKVIIAYGNIVIIIPSGKFKKNVLRRELQHFATQLDGKGEVI